MFISDLGKFVQNQAVNHFKFDEIQLKSNFESDKLDLWTHTEQAVEVEGGHLGVVPLKVAEVKVVRQRLLK